MSDETKRAHWEATREKWELFIKNYEKCLYIREACDKTGVTYRELQYYRDEYPDFAERMRKIEKLKIELAEEELYRRAMGYDETVTKDGKVTVMRRHSDTCLMFYLKAHYPEKYNDKRAFDLNENKADKISVLESPPGAGGAAKRAETVLTVRSRRAAFDKVKEKIERQDLDA